MKPRGTTSRPAPVAMWLVESRLSADVQENVGRIAASEDVQRVAIMPDVHLGKLINNGTVVATSHLLYPQAVGNDIGCGCSAIAFNGTADFLQQEHHAQNLIRAFYRHVPALKQRQGQVLPEKLSAKELSEDRLIKQSHRDGGYQFGTLGCGNHFVELQTDPAQRLWLMIHSGSRAMGQIITEHHLAKAALSSTGLKFLDLESEAGRAYFNDMEWAMQYATLNRLVIMARAVEIMDAYFHLTADEDSYVDSPHNFARRETHGQQELIVHRKSAISARPGELGLIAGSMGSPSFVASGLGQRESLCSSSHGAGRVMSRTEAQARISGADMRHQLGSVHYDSRHLVALRDEAPAAYRDIRRVMQAQRDLTREHTRLLPVLNFKHADPRAGRRNESRQT